MLTTRFLSRRHARGLQRDNLLRRLASMPEGPVLGALAAEGAWPGMRESGGAWVRRLLKLEQLHRVLAALEQPQVMTILTLRRRALERMNALLGIGLLKLEQRHCVLAAALEQPKMIR